MPNPKRRAYLPATPETVAGYLDAISVDLKPATLRRRIAAIRKIHRLTRQVDPTDDEVVVLALRRARRSKPGRQRQALGLASPLRDRLVAACGKSLSGLRDAAMISIGYDTLCRRSELVALRAEDIEPRPMEAPTPWSGVPRTTLIGWGEWPHFLRPISPGFVSG